MIGIGGSIGIGIGKGTGGAENCCRAWIEAGALRVSFEEIWKNIVNRSARATKD